MAEDRRSQLKRLIESGGASLHPLTLSQRELWEASHVPPGDVSNHICAFVETKGLILPETMEFCTQQAVDRQEAMRLSILPGKLAPVQLVRSEGKANTAVQDLPASQDSPEGMEEAMKEHFLKPFDLVRGPLHRVVMVRRSSTDVALVFAIHHAVADGWSLGVFVQDLIGAWLQKFLGRQEPLPPVPQTFTQWAAAERLRWAPEKTESQVAYWKEKLADLPTLFPAAAQTRPQSFLLERWVTAIPAELTQAVRHVAKQMGCTLFSTLLAAYQIAIAKWTGTDDILVGSPVANRTTPAIQETIGYCAGNVPIRGSVDPQRDFTSMAQSVHESTLDAFAHAMPFAELVQALGAKSEPGRGPIYEVRFALQNHPVPTGDLPGLSLRLRMRSTGTSRFALGCEITEEGSALEVVWLGRPDVVPVEELENLHTLFVHILTAACRDPKASVARLVP